MTATESARPESAGAMAPRLRVLLVASEVAPFRQTGGLADVTAALAGALATRGHDVRLVMPLYQGVRWDGLTALDLALRVPRHRGDGYAGVRRGVLPGSTVPVYFLEHLDYYDRPYLYGPPDGDYPDNLERFAFLCRGALELCKHLRWIPDVCHANDWQTALLPVYLHTVESAGPLCGAASVFTIHNLAFQGVNDAGAYPVTGLGPDHFTAHEFEHFGTVNPVKAAIRHSTAITTVSPSYAREIQTSAYGCGLDGPVRERAADVHGILNAIDTDRWDPARDEYLPAHFDHLSLAGKTTCKRSLQHEVGLPVRDGVPLLGVVSRLTGQKGVDVLAAAVDRLLAADVQLVVLGTGEPGYERELLAAQQRHPDRMRCRVGFDIGLAHRIEAGADMFLMPSRFEPCGLNQLYSMRYGTLPVVRRVGGLADTVENYDERTGLGTGFVFEDLTVDALLGTVFWALSIIDKRPDRIVAMRRRGMVRDFSWHRAVGQYDHVYRQACAIHTRRTVGR